MDFAMRFLAAEAAATSQKESVGEIMGGAGMTILTGLVVVFAVLILLTFIFYLFGKVAGRGGKTSSNAAVSAPSPASTQAVPPAPKAARAPVVEDGISDEVVAVIAAAVAAMSEGGRQYSLCSVSRVRGQRPVWAAAGLAENTRPF